MGFRIVFKKTKKNKVYAAVVPAIEFFEGSPEVLTPAIEFQEEGYDFDHYYKTMDEIKEIKKKLAFTIPAISFVDDISEIPKD